jgi:hypothetical protein
VAAEAMRFPMRNVLLSRVERSVREKPPKRNAANRSRL